MILINQNCFLSSTENLRILSLGRNNIKNLNGLVSCYLLLKKAYTLFLEYSNNTCLLQKLYKIEKQI